MFGRIKKKKEETKWYQVGGFLLGVERKSKAYYLVCKNVAQNWSVRWRDDTMMFGLMKSIMENKNASEYLHTLLTVMFISTTYPHDMVALLREGKMPFTKGFTKLVANQNKFELKYKPQPTEEEDAKELQKLKDIADLEEELKNLNEE